MRVRRQLYVQDSESDESQKPSTSKAIPATSSGEFSGKFNRKRDLVPMDDPQAELKMPRKENAIFDENELNFIDGMFGSDDKAAEENELQKRFRRSGSMGIPFVPENEIPKIKDYWSCYQHKGRPLLSLVVGTSRSSGGLSTVLESLNGLEVSIQHIESREAQYRGCKELEVLIQLHLDNGLKPDTVVDRLKTAGMTVGEVACTITGEIEEPDDSTFADAGIDDVISCCPWFPRTIYDLDKCAQRVLMYGSELDADHPGFKDENYRTRRMMFADIALKYKHGQSIPRVEYDESEVKTWSIIYRQLKELHKKHACAEYLENFKLLEKYCGYCEEKIPQLDDISKFLKAKTGFQVRPVAGYLSSRDFLASLAFRVFNCTQYIRHPSDPMYSPEPDCCHELMGHMALFADPDFAQFSQEIGLASLGASEDDLKKLATVYFFTIEFGLCRQRNETKVFGAGLLSSIGELKHAVEDKGSQILPFDPDRVVKQECLITTFQEAYFITENFEEAQQKIRMFTSNLRKPFVVRYNPYTESVEILNNKRSLTLAVNSLRSDITLLAGALHKIL